MPPQMRASYLQSNVASLALLGEEAAARIRADLFKRAPDVLPTIMSASRLDWLPLELDVQLTDAVAGVVGDDGVRKWSAEAIKHSLEGPLLRPILRAAIALFGLTPLSLFRRAPVAWQQIYRECGPLLVELVDNTHVRLRMIALPPAMFTTRAYLLGTAGAFDGVVDVARGTGTVSLTLSPPEATFDAQWTMR